MGKKKTNDTTLVGVGQPVATGAIFVAPLGTAFPSNATDKLGDEFECVGYISEDGVTVGESRDSSEIKEWGGNTVYKSQTSYEATLQFKCIEHSGPALGLRFGKANVIYDKSDTSKVVGYKMNSKEFDHNVIVVEQIISDGVIQRDIYPNAQVSEVGDITYKAGEVIGYDITLTTFPVMDAEGLNSNNAYVYFGETTTASAVANG